LREYIASLICAAAILAVLSVLSYKYDSDAGRRAAFAVLIIWITLVPLAKHINKNEISFPTFDTDMSEYKEEYKSVAENAFTDGVKAMICEKFSLESDLVDVRVYGFDFEKMKAERIKVLLSGKAAAASYKDIEEYVEDSRLGECDAEIEIGE
jgi:hypothetical protein